MKIFNNGFIELVDSMGSDLRICNTARVSFDICKFDFDGSDEKLIQYLARNNHACYSDDTEIFTEKGWILFSELTSNIKIASVLKNGDFSLKYHKYHQHGFEEVG